LLEDILPTMPHYPLGGADTMKGDDEWWARKAKEATVKSLKDDGIMRPPNRLAEEFEDVVTTLEKKQWIAKEAKAVKSNGLLQADYKLAYKNEYDKFMKFLKDEKRRIIYHALKASLGDHYLSAAKVAIFANAASLLEEVNKFMPTETEARKATLISKFWAATFESEGENDIAVWINYISTSVHDLGKLGENISDAQSIQAAELPSPGYLQGIQNCELSQGTVLRRRRRTSKNTRANCGSGSSIKAAILNQKASR